MQYTLYMFVIGQAVDDLIEEIHWWMRDILLMQEGATHSGPVSGGKQHELSNLSYSNQSKQTKNILTTGSLSYV